MKMITLETSGFLAAVKGMRNPLNSWHLNDSVVKSGQFILGDNDIKLAQRLILAGSEHCKFLRQIQVWVDIDMPRYFWSEFDTYHYNSKNSCSTMHKLFNKQQNITKDMFIYCKEDEEFLETIINKLNEIRNEWLNATTQQEKDRHLLRAKRILPEGLLQLRTVNTNYAELRNIWLQRANKPHRLKEEWVETFGEWIKSLPYSEELIMFK